MLSSDSPGTLSLSLSAKITKLSSDSPGSRCQSHHNNLSLSLVTLQALSLSLAKVTKLLTQPNANLTCNATRSLTLIYHAYHYCQELHRPYLPHLSYNTGSQVFQPCSVLWYLPKICSRISQICLCISASKSLRWSRNIAMMSRWFALRRTSSSNGKSHSKRTSKICISRKTLVTLSNPIIQPMYRSSIASRNGRLLVRSSILSADRMAIFLLSLNTSVPTKSSGFSTFTFKNFQASCRSLHLSKHLTCVSRTYSQLQPTNLIYFSLLISRQVVGVFTCPNTSLVSPGPAPNLSLSRYTLNAHLQASSRSFHLSKHLTCVSRTYSQLQPVEIYSSTSQKHVVSGNQLTSHLQQMTLQPTCPKMK